MKWNITNRDLLVKPTKFLRLRVASWITTKYRPRHVPTFLLKMKQDTWKCILQASNQIRLGFCVWYIITILVLDTAPLNICRMHAVLLHSMINTVMLVMLSFRINFLDKLVHFVCTVSKTTLQTLDSSMVLVLLDV
jgi:hypothetical protein